MRKLMLSICAIAITVHIGCGMFSSAGLIDIDNMSGRHIDSIVIDANGYILRFSNIPVGKIVSQSIKSGLIKGGHDITMTSIIYYKDTIVNGDYYYDDLGGFGGKYRLTLDTALVGDWGYKGSHY